MIKTLTFFLAVKSMLPIALGIVATSAIGRHQMRLRRRTADTDIGVGVSCQMSVGDTEENSAVRVTFDFWYAVGSTEAVVSPFEINEVEKKLFYSTKTKILWCADDDIDAKSKELEVSTDGDGHRKQMTEEAREPGVVAVHSSPLDSNTGRECPDKLQHIIERTESPYCTVYHGHMIILTLSAYGLSEFVAEIRSGLRDSMRNGLALGDDTPNVTFLAYLGDTETEAFSDDGGDFIANEVVNVFAVSAESESSENGNAHAEVTIAPGERNETVPAYKNETVPKSESEPESDDDDRSLAIVLGITLPLIILLLVLALCCIRRHSSRSLADDLSVVQKSEGSDGDGDPPGSFHEGLYHYTRDGTGYLSTRCELCRATIDNIKKAERDIISPITEEDSADEVVLEKEDASTSQTESEDSYEDGGPISISPDVNRLGRKHSGIDVHKCSSATCTRCNPNKSQQTRFVPSWAACGPEEDDSQILYEDYRSQRSNGSRKAYDGA